MKKLLILLLIFFISIGAGSQPEEQTFVRQEAYTFYGQGLSTLFDGEDHVVMEHYAIELIPLSDASDPKESWLYFEIIFHYDQFEKAPPIIFMIKSTNQAETYYTFKLVSLSNGENCTLHLTRHGIMFLSQDLNFTYFDE